MEEPIDIVAEMDRDPGTPPICARLTAEQRKALRVGRGRGGKGLKARRLACPGPGLTLTPMGEQWREDLVAIDRKEERMKAMKIIAGKTRIKDNDPRNGSKRGIGLVKCHLSDGRIEVEWSGTKKTTAVKPSRIDDSKHGYSIVE